MRYSGLAMLLLVSVIWGLTWIPAKIGVEAVPPLFFVATRFLAAGVILLILFRRQIDWRVFRARWGKLTIASLLLTTFCYGPIFWGMQYTASGLAGVLNLSLMPVGLLVFGVLLGVETFSYRKIIGVTLGIAGLIALFSPELEKSHAVHAAGVTAIIAGTVLTCMGSVLTRRWFSDQPIGGVSALMIFVGGFGLAVLSAGLEPLTWENWRLLVTPRVLGSWAFLVIFGSVIALTIYLHLLRAGSPVRAGLHAFISPIIALAAGYVFLGERLEPIQWLASGLLLAAAAVIVMPGKKSVSPVEEISDEQTRCLGCAERRGR